MGGEGGRGASFLWEGRAVECQLSYFKPFTEKNPGPNRRQLLDLPLQSFLWTRGATAELPRGWKSGRFGTRGGSVEGGGRDVGKLGAGGGGFSPSAARFRLCLRPQRAYACARTKSPRLSLRDTGAHARQRGHLPRDGVELVPSNTKRKSVPGRGPGGPRPPSG